MAGLLSLQAFSERLVQESFLLRNFSRLMNFSYSSERSLPEKLRVVKELLFFRRESSLRKPDEHTVL